MHSGLLGIDIGTTAIKVMIIEAGQALWSTSHRIQMYQDTAKMRYQKSAEIIAIIDEAILAIPKKLRQRVGKISFSVAMHSVMPMLHPANNPVFIWSDNQAEDTLMKEMTPTLREKFYLLTGTPIHPMSPFAKILHFKRNNLFPEETVWLGLKELVMQYFTGQAVIDVSTASATGICDLAQMSWNTEILQFLRISKSHLAPIVAPRASFDLLAAHKIRYDLPSEVEVICGASDGTLAALAGLVSTGNPNSLTIGTSAAVRVIQKETWLDIARQNFCYRLDEETFVLGAPSNNGGSVLEWARQLFGATAEEFYPMVQQALATTTIGANGVKFYPFLTGERAPYWNTKLKAEFKGVGALTDQAVLVRSILEGMLLNIKQLLEVVPVSEPLSLSGGFFQTEELTQLLVDILGIEGVLSSENEPIYGLYYLLFPPLSKPHQAEISFVPNQEKFQAYAKIAQNYFTDVSGS